MISSGAIAAARPAAATFVARRGASGSSARAFAKANLPSAPLRPLRQQAALRPETPVLSRRNAVTLRCSAAAPERSSQPQVNVFADLAAALKSVMMSIAAAAVAAFSFAGAALARRAAAPPPPPPMNPIEASIALMTSNMTLDAKLQAMAATPSLALVPGAISIAFAALALGGLLMIVSAGSKGKASTRADAIAESQDIDEAPAAAVSEVDEASELRDRLEATRQRIKQRVASVTGVELQEPVVPKFSGAGSTAGADRMKSILTGTATMASPAQALHMIERNDASAPADIVANTVKAVPVNPVELFLAGDAQIATPSSRLHRIDNGEDLPGMPMEVKTTPAKDFRASPAGALLAGSSALASKPSRKIHRFDALPKRASYVEAASVSEEPVLGMEAKYLAGRMDTIKGHFPSALSAADFLFRLEMALCSYNLNGENSIAIVNLCRDEATNAVRHKIEELFPLAFNINGLGGGITCGVTGMGAGLSHSPLCDEAGKQRYIFFSFPHIAINSKGALGALSRPGQDKVNSACGALIAALGQLKAEGLESNIVKPGVHNADDPEYSILKQRIARRILREQLKPEDMDLVEMTKLAERQISSDLEYLISKAVDPKKADYAIVTGVQIHNWGEEFDGDEPNIEFIAPTTVSVIIDGERSDLDLSKMPALSPRMVKMLSKAAGDGDDTTSVCSYTGNSTISDIGSSTMFNAHKFESKEGKKREARFIKFVADQK